MVFACASFLFFFEGAFFLVGVVGKGVCLLMFGCFDKKEGFRVRVSEVGTDSYFEGGLDGWVNGRYLPIDIGQRS